MNHIATFFLLVSVFHYASAQSSALAPAASPPPPVVYSSFCLSGMYNPCGLGSCINLVGSYRCVCPRGTIVSTKLDGRPFCAPSTGSGLTYVTGERDTCYIIAITFRLTIAQLTAQNPSLDCSDVATGLTLNVDSPLEQPSVTCWIRYTVTPVDTCASIRARFSLGAFRLSAINPALDCSNLLGVTENIAVCIRENRERSKFYVCQKYQTPTVSFSRKCRLVAKSARRTQLYNAGLYCGRLSRSPSRFCAKAYGYNYVTCATSYYVTASDSCATLYALVGGETSLAAFNQDFVCLDRFLFVGQEICTS